jgi:predicted DNA-binding protein
MRRKLTVTFTIDPEQLERLDHTASRVRLNRSLIVRTAIDRELARLEKIPDAPSVDHPPEKGSAVATPAAVARR